MGFSSQMHLVFHRAYLESFSVLDLLDDQFGIGQMAEPVFPESQTLDIDLLKVVQQLAADTAIHHQIHMVEIAKEKREVQNVDRRAEPAQGTSGRYKQLDRTLLDSFKHLPLTLAQLERWINFDLDPVFGSFLDQVREFLCAKIVRMIRSRGAGQFHGGLVLSRRRTAPKDNHHHCKTQHQCFLHACSSFTMN